MLGTEPGAAVSGSKYANHCAMLPLSYSLIFISEVKNGKLEC